MGELVTEVVEGGSDGIDPGVEVTVFVALELDHVAELILHLPYLAFEFSDRPMQLVMVVSGHRLLQDALAHMMRASLSSGE